MARPSKEAAEGQQALPRTAGLPQHGVAGPALMHCQGQSAPRCHPWHRCQELGQPVLPQPQQLPALLPDGRQAAALPGGAGNPGEEQTDDYAPSRGWHRGNAFPCGSGALNPYRATELLPNMRTRLPNSWPWLLKDAFALGFVGRSAVRGKAAQS